MTLIKMIDHTVEKFIKLKKGDVDIPCVFCEEYNSPDCCECPLKNHLESLNSKNRCTDINGIHCENIRLNLGSDSAFWHNAPNSEGKKWLNDYIKILKAWKKELAKKRATTNDS